MIRRALSLGFAGLLIGVAAPAAAQEIDVLETAVRAYTERGDARETIRLIGNALDAGTVPPASTPRAHVYMAHSFLALGDTVSALPHVQRALAAEPCLVPEPGFTPPAWVDLYQRARPTGVSCRPKAITATLQSILVPGWGQLSVGRGGASAYFFGATALGAGAAAFFNSRANDHYASYQNSTDPLAVAGIYTDARQAQRYAKIMAGLAGGVYLWNVIDAARSGASHDRGLARVRSLSMIPIIVPNASGASVAVHIPLK